MIKCLWFRQQSSQGSPVRGIQINSRGGPPWGIGFWTDGRDDIVGFGRRFLGRCPKSVTHDGSSISRLCPSFGLRKTRPQRASSATYGVLSSVSGTVIGFRGSSCKGVDGSSRPRSNPRRWTGLRVPIIRRKMATSAPG